MTVKENSFKQIFGQQFPNFVDSKSIFIPKDKLKLQNGDICTFIFNGRVNLFGNNSGKMVVIEAVYAVIEYDDLTWELVLDTLSPISFTKDMVNNNLNF